MNWLFMQMYEIVSWVWRCIPKTFFYNMSEIFIDMLFVLGDFGYFLEGRQTFWSDFINTYNFPNFFNNY